MVRDVSATPEHLAGSALSSPTRGSHAHPAPVVRAGAPSPGPGWGQQHAAAGGGVAGCGFDPEGSAVGQEGVDLPAFAVGGALDPELVLAGVSAGGVASSMEARPEPARRCCSASHPIRRAAAVTSSAVRGP